MLTWWEDVRTELLTIANKNSPCYVYNLAIQAEQAAKLLKLKAIDQIFYAIKANSHPEILKNLYQQGVNFECVSIYELQHVLKLFPNINPQRLLFTPNFAAKSEYEFALSIRCFVTVDNLHPLQYWPDLFKQAEILLRFDPGFVVGHHKHVQTAGTESKFGLLAEDLEKVLGFVKAHNMRIVGLHAHSGSGIFNASLWSQTALFLIKFLDYFPEVKIINLGGGLGVSEDLTKPSLDLSQLDQTLLDIKAKHQDLSFWLEPGRFFVAESGVLLAKVTQCKSKGNKHFVGIETGMNSLLRPALYNGYHKAVNLSRLDEPETQAVNIVGPICESADILCHNQLFPETQENDILLIANTGAYGHCMSSNYNLRPPAQEIIFSRINNV